MSIPDDSWGRTRMDVDRELAELREQLAAANAATAAAQRREDVADAIIVANAESIENLEAQVAALTAERDTAQTELEHWEQEIPRSVKLIETLTDQAEQQAATIRALRLWIEYRKELHRPDGVSCWCVPGEVAAHYPAHGYRCSKARALLAPPSAEPPKYRRDPYVDIQILAGHLRDWHDEEHSGPWEDCLIIECNETRGILSEQPDNEIAPAAEGGAGERRSTNLELMQSPLEHP